MTADKRRIDACLKACEGISTKNLEDNVPFLELARRHNVVLRERDALRAKIDEMGKQHWRRHRPNVEENEMSTEFTREDRYIVFKLSDVERYLTDADRAHLAMMKNEIDAGRDCANKPPFKGLIVESDWPEYEPTWKAIEARVTGAPPAPSVPEGWKLVPIEPTPGMITAALESTHVLNAHRAVACYHAMLAASPEAKP